MRVQKPRLKACEDVQTAAVRRPAPGGWADRTSHFGRWLCAALSMMAVLIVLAPVARAQQTVPCPPEQEPLVRVPELAAQNGILSGTVTLSDELESIPSRQPPQTLPGDPESAFGSFRRILIGRDGRSGRANPLRVLPVWDFDLSLGKSVQFSEEIRARVSLDLFNVFNHTVFTNPALDLGNPRAFGVVTQQRVLTRRESSSRRIQLGLRFEF